MIAIICIKSASRQAFKSRHFSINVISNKWLNQSKIGSTSTEKAKNRLQNQDELGGLDPNIISDVWIVCVFDVLCIVNTCIRHGYGLMFVQYDHNRCVSVVCWTTNWIIAPKQFGTYRCAKNTHRERERDREKVQNTYHFCAVHAS